MHGQQNVKILTLVHLLEGIEIGCLRGMGTACENRTLICNNEGVRGGGQEHNPYDCQIS